MVEQPAKVMRIGSMIKQLLEEVRSAAAGRGRPRPAGRRARPVDRRAGERAGRRPRRGAAPDRAAASPDSTPSDAELRIAQAQLVGWLEGLFHGIQTTLFAQQMAARAQLEQMRRQALPGGPSTGQPVQPVPPGQPGEPAQQQGPDGRPTHGTGQYL